MTCIVGLRDGEQVYIGADSASVAGQEVRATSLHKVFRNGPFLIGYTSSFRMGQILQYHLDVRSRGEDESDMDYMVRGFAEAARDILKNYGFSKIENNVEEGGFFLIAYNGNLYKVDDDFQINEYLDGMMAVGCGSEYALGALWATRELDAEKRVQLALEAAAYFSGYVTKPFHIMVDRPRS